MNTAKEEFKYLTLEELQKLSSAEFEEYLDNSYKKSEKLLQDILLLNKELDNEL